MPDFPRTRPPEVDVATIWAYGNRTLTGLTGSPRMDLMGEDASFEIGTGSRKARIDRILASEPEIEGSVLMNGTELKLAESELGVQHQIEGMIDLTPLASGDIVIVRVYMSIETPVSYVKYAEETYSGSVSPSLLFICTKVAKYGLKVTIQQTGNYRTFSYQFFIRRRV